MPGFNKQLNKVQMSQPISFYSKEIQIMRQSQQKMAFDFCRSKGYVPSAMELHRITDVFVEMCLRPMDDDLKKRIVALDKWIDQKINEKVEELDGILIK